MSKIKENINRILGNNNRLLLPSYWWKRAFGLVADGVDNIEKLANSSQARVDKLEKHVTSQDTRIEETISLVEENVIPLVESKEALESLASPLGTIARVTREVGSQTVKVADCYLISDPDNYASEWDKFTVIKKIEETDANVESFNILYMCALNESFTKDAIGVGYENGVRFYQRIVDGVESLVSLEVINDILATGNYRLVVRAIEGRFDSYFTFYTEVAKDVSDVYIKSDAWEKLSKEYIVSSEDELNALSVESGTIAKVVYKIHSEIQPSSCIDNIDNWDSGVRITKIQLANAPVDGVMAILYAYKGLTLVGSFGILYSNGEVICKDDSSTTISLDELNDKLLANEYKLVGANYIEVEDFDSTFKFYTVPITDVTDAYIKGEKWAKILKEGDITNDNENNFVVTYNENSLSEEDKSCNSEFYNFFINNTSTPFIVHLKELFASGASIMHHVARVYTEVNENGTDVKLLIFGSANDVNLGTVVDAKEVYTLKSDGRVTKVEEFIVDKELSTTSTKAVRNSVVTTAINKKADVDGVYPDMTVGRTKDMLGVAEGEYGEFSFRPTNGDGSIKDGFASIERIEGNSVVWNQLVNEKICEFTLGQGITGGLVDGKIVLNGKAVGYTYIRIVPYGSLVYRANHKYALIKEGSAVAGVEVEDTNAHFMENTIGSVSSDVDSNISVVVLDGVTLTDYQINNIRVFDLTQMFGAGNEPTTIEEFYQRIPQNIDINAYNEGELISYKGDALKSVGFNAWDEQWENGAYNENTGEKIDYGDAKSSIRCKNPIFILPNTKYYFNIPNLAGGSYMGFVTFLDKDKKYIGKSPIGPNAYLEVNTPSNAVYMLFYLRSEYGTTYNNDICINLAHTGYRNGEYEPYKEFTREIDPRIREAFADGMKPWDNVYNKNGKGYIVKGTGVVDMGSLNWELKEYNGYTAFHTRNNSLGAMYADGIFYLCAKYQPAEYRIYTEGLDKSIALNNGYYAQQSVRDHITIRDTSYTDVESFKAAMQDVILYYELAEPIVTEYDEPFNLDYQVWDFGTEEVVSTEKTTPIRASIIYEFNARDTIRANKLALKTKADKTYVDEAIAQAITLTINSSF